MASSAIERRLGRRFKAPRNRIAWRLDRSVRGVPWLRRRAEVGLLVDVSVSGAGVLAPDCMDLQPGSRVTIGFEGTRGQVIVRRISSCGDESQNLYGIEFAEPGSPLTSVVYDTFLAEPGVEPSAQHDSKS
jgi:hypothetical protein